MGDRKRKFFHILRWFIVLAPLKNSSIAFDDLCASLDTDGPFDGSENELQDDEMELSAWGVDQQAEDVIEE